MQQLEQYTKAAQAVAVFKEKHGKVFDEYNSLLVTLDETDRALRTEVRENIKGNVANEFVRVTYSPVSKKVYDVEKVQEIVPPKTWKLIKEKALEQELNVKAIDEMIEHGEIEKKVAEKIKWDALRLVEGTAQVRIGENK